MISDVLHSSSVLGKAKVVSLSHTNTVYWCRWLQLLPNQAVNNKKSSNKDTEHCLEDRYKLYYCNNYDCNLLSN